MEFRKGKLEQLKDNSIVIAIRDPEGRLKALKIHDIVFAIRDKVPPELNEIDCISNALEVIDVEKTKLINSFKSVVEPETRKFKETEMNKKVPKEPELEETEPMITVLKPENEIDEAGESKETEVNENIPKESELEDVGPVATTAIIQEIEEPIGRHNRSPVYRSKIRDLYRRFPKEFTSTQAKDLFIEAYPEVRKDTAINKCRAHLKFLENSGSLQVIEKHVNNKKPIKYKWLFNPLGNERPIYSKINSEYLKTQRALGLKNRC